MLSLVLHGAFAVVGVLALGITLGACSSTPGPEPTDLSAPELASAFARAVIADDFETMKTLVCPDSPDPARAGPIGYEDAAITGPPSDEPGRAAVTVTEPAPDLYVPYKGTIRGAEETGTVDVTFGENEAATCIAVYGVVPDRLGG